MPEAMYSIEDVAKRLKVSPDTVRRLVREGKLEAYKIRGQWRITDEQLSRYLERKRE